MLQSVLGGLYSIGMSSHNESKQAGQRKEALREQIGGAKELAQNQKNQDYDMWKKTGPMGMMNELKQSGLSPGLYYGTGGSGGQMTGGTGGMPTQGAVPDANAATANNMAGLAMLSNIELTKAQTEKVKEETKNIPKTGENIEADTNFKNINTQYANESLQSRLDIIAQEANRAQAEAHRAQIAENVDENTIQDRIAKIRQDATNAAIEGAAMQSGMKLNDAKINEITNNIMQKWKELNIQKDKTGYEHSDRLKAIEEYTSTTLKAAGIYAAGQLVGDVVKIATRQPMKGSISTRTNGEGKTIGETYTRPN